MFWMVLWCMVFRNLNKTKKDRVIIIIDLTEAGCSLKAVLSEVAGDSFSSLAIT